MSARVRSRGVRRGAEPGAQVRPCLGPGSAGAPCPTFLSTCCFAVRCEGRVCPCHCPPQQVMPPACCSAEYVALVRATQGLTEGELKVLSGKFDAVYFHPVGAFSAPPM